MANQVQRDWNWQRMGADTGKALQNRLEKLARFQAGTVTGSPGLTLRLMLLLGALWVASYVGIVVVHDLMHLLLGTNCVLKASV